MRAILCILLNLSHLFPFMRVHNFRGFERLKFLEDESQLQIEEQ